MGLELQQDQSTAEEEIDAKLESLLLLVQKTILDHQDPVTGLFTNNPNNFPTHAWTRDNCYAVHVIWAIHMACKKRANNNQKNAKENDKFAKMAEELGRNCTRVMRSLLECMLGQADKVEQFKKHQRTGDSLHAKYSVKTKTPVVGDNDWGHLQIDAVALFLLTLAQITASGLQIIHNIDEVAFVQNLVYYIEIAYRTPDFGIWERGDKTNQGIRELNASSIGIAKAALQALNDVGDLIVGDDGTKGSSMIHVLPDEIQQCSAVVCNMLPRESFSKETDAGLLSMISYPAFAVDDPELVDLTRETIMDTLGGRYGCKRFLRDGYKTALEDPNRLHYFNSELQKFEHIECEWPMFFCYLYLDAVYRQDEGAAHELWEKLQSLLLPAAAAAAVSGDQGEKNTLQLLPELYRVPLEKVELERRAHGSQDRVPAGTIPFIWSQSLYILCCLLHDNLLSPDELVGHSITIQGQKKKEYLHVFPPVKDPLGRRFSALERRQPCKVQVVVLAENAEVKEKLAEHHIDSETVAELDPKYAILPATALAKILQRIGHSDVFRLSGRPVDRDVQLLSTSRLYHIANKLVAFIPQFTDASRSPLIYDIRVLMDEWSSELNYIYNSWSNISSGNNGGRPLVLLTVTGSMIQQDTLMPHSFVTSETQKNQFYTVLGALKKIKNGYTGGARVLMGKLADFSASTTISKIEFQDGEMVEELFAANGAGGASLPRTLPQESPQQPGTPGKLQRSDSLKGRWSKQFSTVHEASMRHRSIVLDSTDADLLRLRLTIARQAKEQDKDDIINKGPMFAAHPTHLHTSHPPDNLLMHEKEGSNGGGGETRILHSQLEGMEVGDLLSMLAEATELDEQASIVHYLWLKLGPNFDTRLAGVTVTVKQLTEEIYIKACECLDWSWIRLTAGLLEKQLDELDKAVTHLLVRQKQITVGMPSKNEEAITCPKSKGELREIFNRCYDKSDPGSFIMAQELIVSLGSLVRTEPKLFIEMFRLRIGLIIQVLASELSRLRNLKAAEASQQLLSISPFELKSMLFALLSGHLLEESGADTDENGTLGGGLKDVRSGIGSFRKQIEQRKSMRKVRSMRARPKSHEDFDGIVGGGKAPARLTASAAKTATAKSLAASPKAYLFAAGEESPSDSEDSLAAAEEEFQFGIWLRHRRIDGALNRVPNNFYANLWDTLRSLFHNGLSIDGIILGYGLTQEMTRKEIKFALEVEAVLQNQIDEPEYRELIVEVLTLLGKLKMLIMAEPRIPEGRPFEVDYVVQYANKLFVEHNVELGTVVLECCGSGYACDSARGICKHFYDTAPAGEFGTVHYIIRAMIDIFTPSPY